MVQRKTQLKKTIKLVTQKIELELRILRKLWEMEALLQKELQKEI